MFVDYALIIYMKKGRRGMPRLPFFIFQQADKKELFAIAYRFAILMLKEADQQWLKEVLMNEENILEGTWLEDLMLTSGSSITDEG